MKKLVRNKIKEIIEKKGQKSIGYFSNEKERRDLLAAKLVEEAEEFSKDKNEEELADLQEVIEEICKVYGFSKKKINHIQKKKKKEKGGFCMGYVLEAVE